MQIKSIKSKRASSFFLFDAVIAALIFFMTVSIILSMRNIEPNIETPKMFGESLMNYYLETEVREVEHPLIGELMLNRKISDPTNILLEQMIILYAYSRDITNADFVEAISESKIPPNYGYEISITNLTDTKVIYQKNAATQTITSKINLRRVGITKLDNGNIFGPVIVSLSVWY
jgi:hypothetical protein